MPSRHSQPSTCDRYDRLRLADAQGGSAFSRSAFGSAFIDGAILGAIRRSSDFLPVLAGIGPQPASAASVRGVDPTIRFLSSGGCTR
jgi:hypothetical protein